MIQDEELLEPLWDDEDWEDWDNWDDEYGND